MTVGVVRGFSKSYYSFRQIGMKRATRGIGFGEKIDFRRVVKLAFTSPPQLICDHLVPPSLPTCYSAVSTATANWTCPARSCCIHSWYEILTYDLSWGNRVGGAGCVSYFYSVRCCPPELYTPSFGVSVATSDALYPRTHVHVPMYIHSPTQHRRLLGGNALIMPSNFSSAFIFNSSALVIPLER